MNTNLRRSESWQSSSTVRNDSDGFQTAASVSASRDPPRKRSRIEEFSNPIISNSPRLLEPTLRLQYWERSPDMNIAKLRHLEFLEDQGICSERHVLKTILLVADIAMEPNMFPYDTPYNIEHWTLWSRRNLRHREIVDFVQKWIFVNRTDVIAWNYDDNAVRSIDIFHVHIFLKKNSCNR